MSNFIKKYRQSIITVIIIILIACGYQVISTVTEIFDLHLYLGWQEVSINDSFYVKVPGNWIKNEEYGLIYFSDPDIKDDNNIVFFQSKTEDMFLLGENVTFNNNAEKNILSDKFQSIVCLSGTVNSLGSIYGESIISVDDIPYKENYVIFNDNTDDYLFYTWNGKVDYKTLDKIADSVNFTHK